MVPYPEEMDVLDVGGRLQNVPVQDFKCLDLDLTKEMFGFGCDVRIVILDKCPMGFERFSFV